MDPRVRKNRVCSTGKARSEEHTSELQSQFHLVCRLLLEKKKDNEFRLFVNCAEKIAKESESRNMSAVSQRRHLQLVTYCQPTTGDAAISFLLFFLKIRRPARSTLFPYTTLFR